MAKRSQGSWYEDFLDDEYGWILGEDGKYLAEFVSSDSEGRFEEDPEVRRANAAFIVKACNEHDGLVKALKGLTENIPLRGRTVKKDFSLLVAHAAATKALDRIEKG